MVQGGAGRDDFDQKTKDNLAKAANHKCSKCKAATSGAALTPGINSLNIGKAAHICAAAPGGPRFDHAMTAEQRKSMSNGIWLCPTCADLIDKNTGADFSVEKLRELKQKHENDTSMTVGVPPMEPITTVGGTHTAIGSGQVIALDVQRPVNILPGTISRAEGIGQITATRIGPIGGANSTVSLATGTGNAPMSGFVGFGLRCPYGHFQVGVQIEMNVGGGAVLDPKCPECGAKLIPLHN